MASNCGEIAMIQAHQYLGLAVTTRLYAQLRSEACYPESNLTQRIRL